MTLSQHHAPSLAGVTPGDAVTVDGDEAHHAVVVRRLAVGESVRLSDGLGRVVVGEVTATAKRSFTVRATEVSDTPEPLPRLTVVQALAKGDRGERAVEVLTEVGAARIVPWAAARSVAVWRGERAVKSRRKWQATAREASKQARRTWAPTVDPIAATSDVRELLAGADLAVVLHEAATASLAELAVPATGDVIVVVGPEGGLTDDEVEQFRDAGAVPVRLGTEVLRTSTAGVAAVSALLARTPRWG